MRRRPEELESLGTVFVLQMAQHAVAAAKLNVKMSGSAVSTAPAHLHKKVEESMTRNRKKKLKKKRKKQQKLMEQQLAQVEGLAVDADIIQNALSVSLNCQSVGNVIQFV